jgi:hypothetical protein
VRRVIGRLWCCAAPACSPRTMQLISLKATTTASPTISAHHDNPARLHWIPIANGAWHGRTFPPTFRLQASQRVRHQTRQMHCTLSLMQCSPCVGVEVFEFSQTIDSGVPVCNDIEKERDPQQQVFYQTIKASQASRPSSARSQAESGALRNQAVPSLAVDNIPADTTT